MAEDLSIALTELLRKAQMERDVDFLRDGVQALMELEVTQHLGAEHPRDANNDRASFVNA